MAPAAALETALPDLRAVPLAEIGNGDARDVMRRILAPFTKRPGSAKPVAVAAFTSSIAPY